MKTTIGTLKRGGAVLGAFLCATMVPVWATDVAFTTQDITKFVRDAGPGSYTVTLGSNAVELDSAPASNAFNGVTGGDATERALLQKSGGKTMQLIYTISDSAFPGYEFKVCGMDLFRLAAGDYALTRSPKAFLLEAKDGEEWKTLLAVDSQTWDSNILFRSYDIPVANRGNYRSYRFTITENGGEGYWGGMQEIVFTGIITPRLVWNGADGAKWNATDANWLGNEGETTNWIPRAKAVFGEGGSTAITVEGTQEVSCIEFSVTNTCTVSGGALVIPNSGKILAGKGSSINSEIVDDRPETLLSSTERLPANPGNTLQGAWTLLWRNRNLAGITNFTATIDQGGSYQRAASMQNYTNDGETVSVQFQYLISGSALLCVKARFLQDGPDVWARADYAKYSYATGRALGDDFDVQALGGGSGGNGIYVYEIRDNVLVTKSQAYGLYNIQASGGEEDDTVPSQLTLACNSITNVVSSRINSYLPRSGENANTGSAVVCFPGLSLAQLDGLQGAQFSHAGTLRPCTFHYFTNDGTTATVQIQALYTVSASSKARLCVKVEFSEVGGDVYARAVYAKYDWNDSSIHDFDNVPADGNHATAIFDDSHNSGYGVKNLVGIFKGRHVALNGALKATNRIAVDGGVTMTLGAPVLALDREITGDGTVRFAPASGAQTVTISGEQTIDKVAFGGATTLSFDLGASLFIGTAEIEDSAAVSVVGAAGTNLLRIGTSKCLTQSEREHFTVNGCEARQDTDGWVLPKPGFRIIVR